MSREINLRIWVPEGSQEQLLETARNIPGAEIKTSSQIYRVKDLRTELDVYLASFKARVQGLMDIEDDEIDVIKPCYRDLLEETFNERVEKLDNNRFRQLQQDLVTVFLKCTTIDPCLVKQDKAEDARWGLTVLHPRAVDAIIFRFGLADGMLRTYEEVGLEVLGTSATRARQITIDGMKRLRDCSNAGPLREYLRPPTLY